MKKRLSFAMAMALAAATLAGCGGSGGGESSAAPQQDAGSSAAEAADSSEAQESAVQGSGTEVAADAFEIMVAYENNPGEAVDLACNYWKEELEKISGGKMTMTLYPSSQMGDKNEVIDMALSGDSIITIGNDSFYADLGVSDFNVTFAPYLIESWEDFDKIHESDWYAEQVSQLEGLGLHLVSNNWHYGVRHLMSAKPVNSIADLKGMKVRTPNSTAESSNFVAQGAVSTPMALSEVYTALQQGTIDAVENPLDVLQANAFYEVVKNLTLTGHTYINASWLYSEDLWNSLTEEQQGWFIQSGEAAAEYFNSIVEEAADKALEDMKAQGVTVQEFDRSGCADATKAFCELPEINGKWSDGLYEKITEILGR